MVKQYNIIPLNGFLYMVDTEKVAEDLYYCPHKGKNIDVGHGVAPSKPYFFKYDPSTNLCKDCRRIIGASDPSLKDIPQLPEIEENIIAALAKVGLDNPTAGEVYAYKAASKKYSEEDILEAIRKARMERYDSLEKKVVGFSYTKKEILESLTKQPISVSVYIENGVPLVENGYIKVEKYEF